MKASGYKTTQKECMCTANRDSGGNVKTSRLNKGGDMMWKGTRSPMGKVKGRGAIR